MSGILGEIRAFGGNYAPDNWLQCNGQSLSVSQYQALFSLIGNIYGGDSANFNIPDLRGRLMVSFGQAPNNGSNYPIGSKGGYEGVPLAAANIPVHTHTFNLNNQPATTNYCGGNIYAAPLDTGTTNYPIKSFLPNNPSDTTQSVVNLNAATISTEGQSIPHENRQPFLPITYIICVNGTYPQFN